MRTLTISLLLFLIFSCVNTEQEISNIEATLDNLKAKANFNSDDSRVETLFEYYVNKFKEDSPMWATSKGYKGYEGRWSDFTLEEIPEELEKLNDLRSICSEIDESVLSEYNLTYFRLLREDIHTTIDYFENDMYYFPVSQQGGIHQSLPNVFSRHKKSNKEDMENLFKLMESADKEVRNTMFFLKAGLEKNLTSPKVTMKGVPEQILNMVSEEGDESPFFKGFKELDSFSDEEAEDYRDRAHKIIDEKIRPVYKELLNFLEDQYIPNCRESIGLTDLPDGVKKYDSRIRNFTTTTMTAREIHELGLSEVKRIKQKMEKIKDETGFDGDLNAFNEFLRTDPRFFHTSREDLLAEYRDICKRADPELVKLFGKLPRQTYGVIPVPEYLEKYYTTARYQRGSESLALPGYFLANTYELQTRPRWEMEALSLHEAVPGHHLQIALEQEIKDQPEFKKFLGYTVFVEGWGLYAESLGEEMNMYQDPYSKYGQLTYEMWRAIRLVVDPGMHALGWSRDDAINYFMENSAKTRNDVEVEVDRYIGWPGQALAYKIGELKLKELRAKSKEKLGEDFDIREFHDLILSKGSLPINVLEQLVDDWLADFGREL